MKSFILSFIIATTFCGCFAQPTISLEGKIIDNNKEPIVYANISIKGTSKGVVSNSNGYFKIAIPEVHKKDTLQISFIGYHSSFEPIQTFPSGKVKKIVLHDKVFELSGTTIKPETGREVIIKAISRIPKNYCTEPFYFDAFYRESLIEDSVYTQLAEAACRFHLDSLQKLDKDQASKNYYADGFYRLDEIGFPFDGVYDNRTYFYPNDQVKIIAARSSEYNSNSLSKFTIIGGPLSLYGCDKVRYQIQFLDVKKIKNYSYEIEAIQNYEHGHVYKIHFKQRKNRKRKFSHTGYIYIDTKSYAFVEFDYDVSENFLSYRESGRFNSVRHGIEFHQRKPIIDKVYFSGSATKIKFNKINDIWFLKNIHQEEELIYLYKKENIEIKVTAIGDLMVNNIILKNVKPFSNDSVFRAIASNDLFNYPFDYNKGFWDNYNILQPTKIEEKAINDLQQSQSLEEQFKSKFAYQSELPPPLAKIEPTIKILPFDTINDNYDWLKKRKDKNAQDYLEAENDYTRNFFLPLFNVQKTLFNEMTKRIPARKEKTTPVKIGKYLYYLIEEKNQNHPRFYRELDTINSDEELILDIPKLAKNKSYYGVGDFDISPNDNILSYSEDITGNGDFYYLFKNLKNKQYLNDTLYNAGSLIWLQNNKAVIYSLRDTLRRIYQINIHYLNTHQDYDKVIYTETDKSRDLSVDLSKSKEYVFLYSANANEQEVFLINLNKGNIEVEQYSELTSEYEIHPEHYKNDSVFYIYTNKDAPNWKLCVSPMSSNIQFSNIIANENQEVILSNYKLLKDHKIFIEQTGLTQQIKIIDKNNKISFVPIKSKFCTISLKRTEFDTDSIVYSVSTIGEPAKTFSYNLQSKKVQLLKEKEVLGFNPSKYKTELVWATSEDGTEIPIFLFYNKKQSYRKSNYLLLEAYGAYSSPLSYHFPASYLSLIDRGFIYAKALIRGGAELGDHWSKDGKLLNKMNSFNDFVACSKHLIDEEYTSPDKLVIEGGSAGGLVMGYAINEYPELYQAAILSRPFVDVLNTLLDTTITLTIIDWDEWGNPNNEKYYNYIKSYSPYDNIKKQEYPNMLFITGAKDEQVNYWEPAKMVAKLRAKKTDNNTLLLKTYMSSGHGGVPGKYGFFSEQAMVFSFILKAVGYY